MAIDLSENGRGYQDLLEHIGHKLVCVHYGLGTNPVSAAIECEDCGVVLVDFNIPEPPEVEPEEKGNREIPEGATPHDCMNCPTLGTAECSDCRENPGDL